MKKNNNEESDGINVNETDLTPPEGDGNNNQPPKDEGKKTTVVLRHKTEYPAYRRAGLVLTQLAKPYEVTEAQLAELKKDKWVVIGEDKEKKDDK